jgi:hypothetical protein
MEVAGPFKMLVHIYQTALHHHPKEYHCENLKSHIISFQSPSAASPFVSLNWIINMYVSLYDRTASCYQFTCLDCIIMLYYCTTSCTLCQLVTKTISTSTRVCTPDRIYGSGVNISISIWLQYMSYTLESRKLNYLSHMCLSQPLLLLHWSNKIWNSRRIVY